MPFFVVPLFIGMAAAAGTAGVGMAAKGSLDQHTANQLNDNSGARIRWAANNLEKLRGQCSDSLNALGKEKVIILDGSVQRFLDAFQQLKNVDFTASEGLDELNKLRIDKAAFDELKTMGNIASSLLEGGVAGAASGALAAFGAYSAASALATASTGTAISALSGVAASNATLAFFGGGPWPQVAWAWPVALLYLEDWSQVLHCWSWALSSVPRVAKTLRKRRPSLLRQANTVSR